MPQPNRFALPSDLRWKAYNWAAAAKVDHRTVSDYLTGRRNPRPAQREAIERVLRESGRADLIRAEGA